MLYQPCISPADLRTARKLLETFNTLYEKQYPNTMWTFNVHSVRHLADQVGTIGPLWASSAFSFESANAHLRNLANGTNNIDGQIVDNFLAAKQDNFKELKDDRLKLLCKKLMNTKKN